MRIWQQMSRLFGILWRRLLLSLDDDQWRMMPLMDELPAAVVNSRPTNFNANKKIRLRSGHQRGNEWKVKRKEKKSVIRANHHAAHTHTHTLACSFFSSIHALSDHLPSVTSFRLSDPLGRFTPRHYCASVSRTPFLSAPRKINSPFRRLVPTWH